LGVWTSGTLDDLGGKGFFNGGIGRTWGDSAYNGTIAWIQDLTMVANQTGAANAFTTEPPVFSQALIQKDAGPFTTEGAGELVVHSAGTRNPFGLCLDSEGRLWFTNNFNRTVTRWLSSRTIIGGAYSSPITVTKISTPSNTMPNSGR
jgi:hypothetical protein